MPECVDPNASCRPDLVVFLDDGRAEAAVPFVVGASGKSTITIPPVGDQASDAYALQAVQLFDSGELRPTNAVPVRVVSPDAV